MRVFYDTVVLVLSLNHTDPDYTDCVALLDPAQITWELVISEISRAESSIVEYIDALIVSYAAAGVVLTEVLSSAIQGTKRANQSTVNSLRKCTLQSRDLSQLMAARSAAASLFLTRDADFIDPRNKATPGGRGHREVARIADSDLGLEVLFPREARSRLLP